MVGKGQEEDAVALLLGNCPMVRGHMASQVGTRRGWPARHV